MTRVKLTADVLTLAGADHHFLTTLNEHSSALDALEGVGGALGYDVTAFGATGDGVTDDRASIQACLAAAAAAGVPQIYIPPGTYKVGRNGANSYALDIPGDNIELVGAGKLSVLKFPSGMPNASVSLVHLSEKKNCTVRDLVLDGNWGQAVTTVEISSHNVALPTGTINVVSTAGFPSSGTITVVTGQGGAGTDVTYTGITATSFTGCTNGTGTISWGDYVGYIDPGHRSSILAASNGATLPIATINVADTTDFPSSGTVTISLNSGANVQVTYTGKTATTLTGCAGGTGTLATSNVVTPGLVSPGGNHVAQLDPKNHGIFARAVENFTVRNVEIRGVYGDGVWLGTSTSGKPTRKVHLENVTIDRAGRNGFSFGGGVSDVTITSCRTSNIVTQDVDSEPQTDFSTVRDIRITDSYFGGYWHMGNPARSANAILSCIGAITRNPHYSSYATNWRITGNTFVGSCLFNACSDVVFKNNRVLCNFSGGSTAPISITSLAEHVTIENNWVYGRTTPAGIGSSGNRATIQCFNTLSTGNTPPRDITIKDNRVFARNGHAGIYIEAPGGQAYSFGASAVYQPGVTGTATAILDGVQGIVGSGGQLNRLQDSGATWTVNQWSGYFVKVGNAVASIALNTATELQLGDVPSTGVSGSFTQKMAWTDAEGRPVPTPAAGTYTIFQPTGFCVVEGNTVDCGNGDGHGAGGNGIRALNDYAGSRVIIKGNRIKNATGAGIYFHSSSTAGKAYKHLEVSDNVVWDDQVVPTCTYVMEFSAAMLADKWIMKNNSKGDGVITGHTLGLSTGTWLVNDGNVQDWAGYGTPESVVTAPVGSRYQRLNGGAGTSSYVKESGTGNTGWVAK